MRLFVGIPLAVAVADELSAVSVRLHSSGGELRWATPASWHVSLQFLGNADPGQYDCVVARLRELHLSPVPVRLEELGFFDQSGIFLASVKASPELLLLQKSVVAATALCGFDHETRPYQPHITLARSKGRVQRQSFRDLKAKIPRQLNFTPFVAEEFFLYESFLGAGGSRYEVRARFPLGHRSTGDR